MRVNRDKEAALSADGLRGILDYDPQERTFLLGGHGREEAMAAPARSLALLTTAVISMCGSENINTAFIVLNGFG